MVSDLDKGILLQFRKRLKSLRQSKILTLRKIILLYNVEYIDIKSYETGKVIITLLSLAKLAKELEVEPKDLLNFFKEAE